MAKFERHLEAKANRGKLQEEGYNWLYPSEWDTIKYSSKFKVLCCIILTARAPQISIILLHISYRELYYFISQTGNIAMNDTIFTRLFVGSLKG